MRHLRLSGNTNKLNLPICITVGTWVGQTEFWTSVLDCACLTWVARGGEICLLLGLSPMPNITTLHHPEEEHTRCFPFFSQAFTDRESDKLQKNNFTYSLAKGRSGKKWWRKKWQTMVGKGEKLQIEEYGSEIFWNYSFFACVLQNLTGTHYIAWSQHRNWDVNSKQTVEEEERYLTSVLQGSYVNITLKSSCWIFLAAYVRKAAQHQLLLLNGPIFLEQCNVGLHW